MSDEETIRTKALTYTRENWKVIIAWVITAVTTGANAFIAIGHKQAGSETLVGDVATLKTDMKGLKDSVASTNVSLARIEGTLNGINMKADEFGEFKKGVQTGAREALATPIPKGPQGRRAKH